jgi:hypothetical protein
VLDAAREQDLHADADAEHRAAAGQPAADHPVAADRAQALHAGRERADTGHQQAVGLQRGPEVGGHLDLGADPFQGPLRGAEIAGAVVEDDHVLRHWGSLREDAGVTSVS